MTLHWMQQYECSLKLLAEKLNEIHGCDHSVRYWRILVGPWLGYFLQMLFDRWFMLQKAAKDYDILGVKIINRRQGDLIPNDMEEFSKLFDGDNWNELIYGQILSIKPLPFDMVHIASTNSRNLKDQSNVNPSASKLLKRSLANKISRFSGAFSRDDEYFFISSYLELKNDLLLQFKLGQLPKLWLSEEVPNYNFSIDARLWELEKEKLVIDDHLDFLNLVSKLIPQHIPKACQG